MSEVGRPRVFALTTGNNDIATALFSEITGKTNSISQTFDKRFVLKYHDLEQFEQKVTQFFQRSGVAKLVFYYEISLSSGEVLKRDSLESLQKVDSSSPHHVDELTATAEVLLDNKNALSDKGVPYENYKIVMSARALSMPAFFNIKEYLPAFDFPRLSFSIEFNQYVVAQSLKGVLNDWCSSLETIPENDQIPKIAKISYFLNINTLTISYIVVSVSFLLWFDLGENASGVQIANTLFLFFLIVNSTSLLVRFTLQKMYDAVRSITEHSVIMITKGDERRMREINDENRRFRKISVMYFLGVLFEIFLGVVLSALLV
ncbi:MAG: hypothetical protein AAFY41_14685 [Bacteroidota bacterium]